MFGFADVGAATSSKLSGHAELHAIYVDPTFARRGAGQALFRARVDRDEELRVRGHDHQSSEQKYPGAQFLRTHAGRTHALDRKARR